MSAAELRSELKALRKEHPDHAPVSKMKKKDVSDLIQRLKAGREETPPVASITAASTNPGSSVESLKKAKASEFPLATAVAEKAPKKAPAAKPKKEIVASAVKASKAKEVALKANGASAGAPQSRPAKGSDEMKARMAAIRVKRAKKDE
jgi:hypothetical protein